MEASPQRACAARKNMRWLASSGLTLSNSPRRLRLFGFRRLRPGLSRPALAQSSGQSERKTRASAETTEPESTRSSFLSRREPPMRQRTAKPRSARLRRLSWPMALRGQARFYSTNSWRSPKTDKTNWTVGSFGFFDSIKPPKRPKIRRRRLFVKLLGWWPTRAQVLDAKMILFADVWVLRLGLG